VSSFKESQSIEQDEVGNNTQDTASEKQDSFEETPQVSASQTSMEKNAAPPSHGSLSGKRNRLQMAGERTLDGRKRSFVKTQRMFSFRGIGYMFRIN